MRSDEAVSFGLKPFRLTIIDHTDDYNLIIWLAVYWPNPHYFRAYLNHTKLHKLEVDG